MTSGGGGATTAGRGWRDGGREGSVLPACARRPLAVWREEARGGGGKERGQAARAVPVPAGSPQGAGRAGRSPIRAQLAEG